MAASQRAVAGTLVGALLSISSAVQIHRLVSEMRDESVAERRIGLARSDVIDEVMCSPRQAELRAKARGLKVPPELIGSSRSGVSLVRSENVRAPVPGRGEIARSFSEALTAFQEEANHGGKSQT